MVSSFRRLHTRRRLHLSAENRLGVVRQGRRRRRLLCRRTDGVWAMAGVLAGATGNASAADAPSTRVGPAQTGGHRDRHGGAVQDGFDGGDWKRFDPRT
jgi:hypothetical protein